MSLRVPSKLTSRYDVLDSLRDGRGWTAEELRADTGRTWNSIDNVGRRLAREGLLTWVPAPNVPRVRAYLRITDAGLRWLWAVDRDLPGQAVDLLLMILECVEDGPILTREVKDYRRGRVRNSAYALVHVGALRIEHRVNRGGDGGTAPSRLHLTEYGRELLDSMRGLECFRTWTKTCSKAG